MIVCVFACVFVCALFVFSFSYYETSCYWTTAKRGERDERESRERGERRVFPNCLEYVFVWESLSWTQSLMIVWGSLSWAQSLMSAG